jgi:glycosyltransferase involved in cell wall biosynthesis
VRILHAPVNIANQAGYVVGALRRMGHQAEIWEYGRNAFGFPADRTIPVDAEHPEVFWRTFEEAVGSFDVFHFHFGRSLFPYEWGGWPPLWDLPVLRALGKKVFFTFHGTDVRIRRIHEQVMPWSFFRYSDVTTDDDLVEKTLEVCRTYANRMFVVSVDYLDYLPQAEVLPRVIDLDLWEPQPVAQRDTPVVLHVPSRRGTKGTDMILAGLERLRVEGVPFELRLLEGVPHEEARRAIRDADVVVDNVLTGDYELVSIEAMASSRVAVANVGDPVRRAFPEAPVWSVDPDTFDARMRSLLADAGLRGTLAERGRDYVARIHDAPVIARRLVAAYEADYPPVARSFPDWMSLGGQRRVELLERRTSQLEADLARATRREDVLRRRLGLPPVAAGAIVPPRALVERAKDLLPRDLRVRLRRARARLEGRPGRR